MFTLQLYLRFGLLSSKTQHREPLISMRTDTVVSTLIYKESTVSRDERRVLRASVIVLPVTYFGDGTQKKGNINCYKKLEPKPVS